MPLSSVSQGQSFVMLDARGEDHGLWQVLNAAPMADGRVWVTIFDEDDPADSIDLYAEDLLDPTRFRLIDEASATRREADPDLYAGEAAE